MLGLTKRMCIPVNVDKGLLVIMTMNNLMVPIMNAGVSYRDKERGCDCKVVSVNWR